MDNNKMIMVVVAVIVVILGGVLLFTGGDDDEAADDNSASTSQVAENNDEPAEAPAPAQNIVELAQGTDSLSVLVSAVVEAELVETLSGDGPFTVFAPTDDAFGALLTDLGVTAEELLARDDLGAILTYHVVAGDVRAADLSDGQVVETVQGGTLTVNISDAGVTLTDANGGVSNITATDIEASNGVVHLIDAVVLP